MNTCGTITLTETNKERLLAILNSWHKIEFFIPFDLRGSVINRETPSTPVRMVYEHELREKGTVFDFKELDSKKTAKYDLYIGVFDKNEIAPICNAVLGLTPTPEDQLENQERGDLEGETCFAKIKLNEQKEPLFDEISVSTLPWALGVIQHSGLDGLTAKDFAQAKDELSGKLHTHASRRKTGDTPQPLTAGELIELRDLFYGWAGFSPGGEKAVAILQQRISEKRNSSQDQNAPLHDEEDLGPEIDILNSFYVQDIERAMQKVAEGKTSGSLYHYLTPIDDSRKRDLYSEKGRQAILEKLHPRLFNRGHWFDKPEHLMSLMQQFAINTALKANAERGIFSVNGPPGTGKTTLLRDLIAENIVRRASVLASLPKASAAFVGKHGDIPIGDSSFKAVVLRPELTGFEMVVASTNNAAANNISQELPKTSSLDESWQHLSYIQPTAQKIAYQDTKRNLLRPDEADPHWGLISCALGNSGNRYNFKEKFYFNSNFPEQECARGLLHIRDWISKYDGPGFSEAKDSYCMLSAAVEEEIENRAHFVDLMAELHGQTEESFTSVESSKEKQSLLELNDVILAAANAEHEIAELQHDISRLDMQREQIQQDRPGLFSRLLRLGAARKYLDEMRAIDLERKAILANINAHEHKLKALKIRCAQAQSAHDSALGILHEKKKAWGAKQQQLVAFESRYGGMRIPTSPNELDNENYQINGLWNDRTLSKIRSELFQAALALHEAWLADVGRKSSDGGAGFNINITAIAQLLGGHTSFESEVTLTIWQSLFMIIPVVSTTFASFASQFKQLGQGSLGWVFIDEAGQAVPQAGVGALWRARNAVVVGDPLQIEPVFTVPTGLIRSISSLSTHTENNDYAPDRVSAQNLADASNEYGAYASNDNDEHPIWIGSPLRVHRRCAEPMFTVSNEIAYGGTMVYGLNQKTLSSQPLMPFDSAWIDIPGEATNLQVVPAQIDFVVHIIIRLHTRTGELPTIYIISPFKAIAQAIHDRLNGVDWAIYGSSSKPGAKDITKWCKERVGTVHTFQGKEEDCVVMVLGADRYSRIGAAKWAASKPNLLNVAVTRAKKRCFIVGDSALWAKMKYFPVAQRHFETATPEAILDAINSA